MSVCTECPSGTFGYRCLQNCSCRNRTTDTCHHVDGSCKCKPGYQGVNCSKCEYIRTILVLTVILLVQRWVWLAQLVRSLPFAHKVPSSIPGSVEI